MAWGSNTALVCIHTKTGKMQRYVRTINGFPAHAGRAFLEIPQAWNMAPGELASLVEGFRVNPDTFQVEPEAA